MPASAEVVALVGGAPLGSVVAVGQGMLNSCPTCIMLAELRLFICRMSGMTSWLRCPQPKAILIRSSPGATLWVQGPGVGVLLGVGGSGVTVASTGGVIGVLVMIMTAGCEPSRVVATAVGAAAGKIQRTPTKATAPTQATARRTSNPPKR